MGLATGGVASFLPPAGNGLGFNSPLADQPAMARFVLWGTQLQALGAVMAMEEELSES
jgi:hypothetical protein